MSGQISKDEQLTILKNLINNQLVETLLGDILSDSLKMLEMQLNSDMSFAFFRDYDSELKKLRIELLELYDQKDSLTEKVNSLNLEIKKLTANGFYIKDDLIKIAQRLRDVVN